MNRFKKEIRRKGIMMEIDYEYLPCNGIETIRVDAETASIKTYHNCYGWSEARMIPAGDLIDVDAAETLTNETGDTVIIYPTLDGHAVMQYWYVPGVPAYRHFLTRQRARNKAYDCGYID
jgi:hypothetical protein